MENKNHTQRTFEYLNYKNSHFNGYDTILYTELTLNEGNISFPKIIDAIENINYYSNCESVFDFYFPIVSHVLFYKPEYGNRILTFIVGPIFALGLINNEDDFIKIINDVKTYYLKNNPYMLTDKGIAWIDHTLVTQKVDIRKEIDNCIAELND